MKQKIITELKKELLVVELPRLFNYGLLKDKLIIDELKENETFIFKGSYTLLGSPDEIREEDVKKLVHLHICYSSRQFFD